GVEVMLRSDGLDVLDRATTVVKSPGVPREAPVVADALARGLEVTGELELAWRLLPNPFIAGTGTNGKATTVELVGAIRRAAGVRRRASGEGETGDVRRARRRPVGARWLAPMARRGDLGAR